jgi:hypothetical protein
VEAGPFRKRGVEAMAGAGREEVAGGILSPSSCGGMWETGKQAGCRRALEGKSKTRAHVLGEDGGEC